MNKTKWVIDAAHSEVQFKVKHLMITNVTGFFKSFESTVETNGEDFSTAQISFSADVNSLTTNNEQRDQHLQSADFFDAENHPKLSFNSTKMEKISDEEFRLQGNISIRGTEKPITLKVEFGGFTKDPWDNERAGFEISGKLNRKDFGLHWSATTEAGGVVVSDEVRMHIAAQFIKQA